MNNCFAKVFCISVLLARCIQTLTASPLPDSAFYAIRHYTSEKGLPQNSVKSIARDRHGFIWLATENGMVRFDGWHFQIYNKNNTSISSNRMRYIFRDQETQNLLALTNHYDLIRLGEEGAVSLNKRLPDSIDYPISPDSVLNAYRRTGLPDLFYEDQPSDAYIIPKGANAAFVTARDTIRFYEGKKESWKIHTGFRDLERYFRLNDGLYYFDNDGTFAAVTKDSVRKFRLTGDILDHTRNHGIVNPKLYWNITSGDVFIYLNSYFYLLEQTRDGLLNTRLLLSGFDFELKSIQSVYYDRKTRRLFLGSLIRGLFVISPKSFIALRSGEVAGGDETYYSQAAFSDTSVLTNSGNILGPDGLIGKRPLVKHYNDSYSMLTDRDGNIWTKRDNRVYHLSGDGRLLLRQFDLPGAVTQLYEDRLGAIWIGTRKSGLFRLDPSGKEDAPDLFSGDLMEITYMMQENRDLMWVATEAGLYKVNFPEGKTELIPGTETIHIRSIHISHSREIWFTTAEHGLFLYKNERLTNFPQDENNYLAASHCILEDANGYFWITTNRGIFQAHKDDLLAYASGEQDDVFYLYYGKEAGFNTNEFNGGCQPCGITLENGYYSFPSLNGLVWFKPEEVAAELPLNDIYIDEIEVDSTLVPVRDTLKLISKFNRMLVYFSTPYFGDPYNLSFRYRLKGSSGSDQWLELANSNVISFSSLPSGVYDLTIRKSNGFYPSGYTEKRLVIMIPPAWYETWWFRASVLLVLILSVLCYIRFRLNSIKRKNESLEKRISERTHRLKETIFAQRASEDRLKQQNYLQQRLLAVIAHDIMTPLQYLEISARNTYEQFPEKNGSTPEALKRIHRSAHRLFHFTDNLVQYMKVSLAGTPPDNEQVCLVELIGEKVAIFSEAARQKGNIIENTVTRTICVRSNRQLLSIVLHNLLDNAVKYTRGGRIVFSATHTNQGTMLILDDTGKGMDEKLMTWCNNFVSLNPDQETIIAANGLGLTIVRELLGMMDIKMLALPGPEGGTRIELLF